MAKWGFTEAMRWLVPYGLDRDLLQPAKIITDPVHADIRLTELERRIVDSPPFQRLRRVKQLGATHLVYPGATHTRFSHALGAVEAAQMLLDIVVEQRDEPNARADLFAEWERDEDRGGPSALKRIAEAVVLTRLGALLHDLCHVPFGHTVEDELRLLTPHDENRDRFDGLWLHIDATAREAIENGKSLSGRRLLDDLLPIILSGLDKDGESEEGEDPGVARGLSYPFAQDIVGNTISADLMDYIARDHLFTGLPAAFGHRFLDSFYVSPSTDPHKPQRMILRVVKRGRERKDTLTELLKFLRYRYELSERALAHHAKLAADAMVGKLLQLYHDGLYVDEIQRRVVENKALAASVAEVSASDIDELRSRAAKHLNKRELTAVAADTRSRLEATLLRHGDDGLLEYLRDQGEERQADSRWAGIRDLAEALLDRRLFKHAARMDDRRHARRLWTTYGKNPNHRRQVEQVAARFAGIKPAWYAVMWIPPERMRLKPALVLVDDENIIDTMLNRERSSRVLDRGRDIYDAHRDLWALEVFVHPTIKRDPVAIGALLSAIAAQLHIKTWADADAPVVPADVARVRAAVELSLGRVQERELEELVPSFYDGSVGLSDRPTLNEMVDELKLAWDAAHPADRDRPHAAGGADDEVVRGLDVDEGGEGQQTLT
jgi:HD superfamily phosphohydrolase